MIPYPLYYFLISPSIGKNKVRYNWMGYVFYDEFSKNTEYNLEMKEYLLLVFDL